MRAGDPFHLGLLAGTTAVLVLAVLLAWSGVPMAVCLIVLMFAPMVVVVGYELLGYRHMAVALERVVASGPGVHSDRGGAGRRQ
jgi:hypothetical protein